MVAGQEEADMRWDGKLATMPMVPLAAGTPLHHGTDCAGGFEFPDGPAWFAGTQAEAADWAGWNVPPDGREDGERRTHAYVTTADLSLVDVRRIRRLRDGWERLCLAAAGEFDELLRDEVAAALAAKGYAGWVDGGEVMLTDPAGSLRFLGRTHVPGDNLMRPQPSTYRPARGPGLPSAP